MTSQIDHLRIESNEQTDGTIVLTVAGEADVESAASLRAVLAEAANRSPSAIVLDLAGLEFIDSSGISVLLDAQLRADGDGRPLKLTNLPAQVARIFTVAGLASKFTITPPIPA